MRNKFDRVIAASFTDETHRRVVVFNLLNVLLALVALTMTLVNLNTGEYELMCVTAAYSLLCTLNYILVQKKPEWKEAIFSTFSIEAEVLLVYFVLGGVPDGFSALWTLLVPAVGLSVFGIRIGIRFALLTFSMILFFFWVPMGRDLLYYRYSETFMLRFPFVYLCLFFASVYMEVIRLGAYNRLKETEETARYLYRHDALTGAYTRHAFSEELQQIFETPSESKVCLAIFDIDDFKTINDRYGHNAGDEVLKSVVKIIQEHTCEHCVVCRWGGEEFLVLMQCDHDPLEISQEIRTITEHTAIVYNGAALHVTLSIGIAVTDKLSRAELSDFINCADKAMYTSKLEGKNRITLTVFPGMTP